MSIVIHWEINVYFLLSEQNIRTTEMNINLMNFIGGINVYVTSPSHLIICSAQSVPGLVGVVRRGSSRSSLIGAETFFITVMLLQSPRCPG